MIEETKLVLAQVKEMKKKKLFIESLDLLERVLAKDPRDKPEIAAKLLGLCVYLFEKTNRIQFLIQAEGSVKKIKGKIREKVLVQILKMFNYLALYARTQGNYESCLAYLADAVRAAEGQEPSGFIFEKVAKLNLNLSSVMLQIQNFQEGIDYAENALVFFQKAAERTKSRQGEEHNDTVIGYLLSFYCISVGYGGKGLIKEAREALLKAIEIGKKIFATQKFFLFEMILQKLQSLQLKKNENFNEKCIFHLNLPQSLFSLKFFDPAKNNPEQKTPGRYYTNSQLIQKQKMFESENKLNFISANDYFFHEISKAMNIKSDVKFMKISPDYSKKIIVQESLEKRKLTDLKLKKKKRVSSASTTPCLKNKVENCNIVNTPQKNRPDPKRVTFLLNRICAVKKRDFFPSQKLFFKPNSANPYLNCTSHIKSPEFHKKSVLYQSSQNEIEEIMNEINSEIKKMTQKEPKKIFTPNFSARALPEGKLKKSLKKNLKKIRFFESKKTNSLLKPKNQFKLRRLSLPFETPV